MKRVNCFLTGMALMFAVSCVAPEEWHTKYDNVVPGPVTIVDVKNVNGGAIIYYTLPPDMDKKDMLGAKVVYSLKPGGDVLEKYASAKTDSIELEGFGNTDERMVILHAVHKNGNVSAGREVTIKPDTPAIVMMRESLKAEPTFGGIKITWDNVMRKDMGISLFVEDSITHEMVVFDNYYSNAIDGKIVFRPFKSKEQKFHIEMFDKWENFAKPMDISITPLFEIELIPRENGVQIWTLFDDGRVIPGNASSPLRYTYRCDIHSVETGLGANRPFTILFDNRGTNNGINNDWFWLPGNNQTLGLFFPTGGDRSLPFPLTVTFDMGRKAIYSRMNFVPRQRSPLYSAPLAVNFEIWGTNNPKTIEEVEDPHGEYPKGSREANQAYWSSWAVVNGTDAWKDDGWVLLATCILSLSSGDNKYYDNVPLSSEDIARYEKDGFDFDFNMDVMEPFRYLRWVIHETNTDQKEFNICKLYYWGIYADE